MRIFRLHSEFERRYLNALVYAKDEQEALSKFREVFELPSVVAIRIEGLELSGRLIL